MASCICVYISESMKSELYGLPTYELLQRLYIKPPPSKRAVKGQHYKTLFAQHSQTPSDIGKTNSTHRNVSLLFNSRAR